ncbi:MAG: type II toxin-antitoxin system VapB family antitoxin [Pseudomonadota bacterium]
MDTAKIFWSGRSQAVRLPKEYRFEGVEVRIRRQGRAVVLEPVAPEADEWAWLDKVVGPVDEDFKRAALDRSKEPPPERPEVNEFFK